MLSCEFISRVIVTVLICLMRIVRCTQHDHGVGELQIQCNAGVMEPALLDRRENLIPHGTLHWTNDDANLQYSLVVTSTSALAVNLRWAINGSKTSDISDNHFFVADIVLATRHNTMYGAMVVPTRQSKDELFVNCLALAPGTTNLTSKLSIVQANNPECAKFQPLTFVEERCREHLYGDKLSVDILNIGSEACLAWEDAHVQDDAVLMHLHVTSFPKSNSLFFHVSASNVNPYASSRVKVCEDNPYDVIPRVLAQTSSISSADGNMSVRLSATVDDNNIDIGYYAALSINCGRSIYTEETYMTYDFNFTLVNHSSSGPMWSQVLPPASNLQANTSPVHVMVVTICGLLSLTALTSVAFVLYRRRKQTIRQTSHGSKSASNNMKYTRPIELNTYTEKYKESTQQLIVPKIQDSKLESSYYVVNMDDIDETKKPSEGSKLVATDDCFPHKFEPNEVPVQTSMCQLKRGLHKQSPVMLIYHPDNESHNGRVRKLCTQLTDAGHLVEGWSTDVYVNWRDFADMTGDTYKDILIVVTDKLYTLCAVYAERESSKSQQLQAEWEQLVVERHGEYVPCLVLDKLRTMYQEHRRGFMVHVVALCEKDYCILDTFIERFSSFLKDTNTLKYCLNFNRQYL